MATSPHIPFFSSLRFKIGVGYVILVVINVGISVWTIINFGRLTASMDTLQTRSYQNVIAAENMARAVESHSHGISDFLNGDLNNGKIEFVKAKEDFSGAYAIANKNTNTPEARQLLDTIHATYDRSLTVIDSLTSLANAHSASARPYYYNTVSPLLKQLSDNCVWLFEENQRQMLEVRTQIDKIASDSMVAIVTAALLAIGLSLLTMMRFTQTIIKPAERLTATVHQIGRGHLDLKTEVRTNDEIGVLAAEFNKMTERLRRFEDLNIEKMLIEKQKSETIVGNINDAIIMCDASGAILLINPAAEKF